MLRFHALLPLACAIAAFVLGMLCLFAGHEKNFMEEYHIAMVCILSLLPPNQDLTTRRSIPRRSATL